MERSKDRKWRWIIWNIFSWRDDFSINSFCWFKFRIIIFFFFGGGDVFLLLLLCMCVLCQTEQGECTKKERKSERKTRDKYLMMLMDYLKKIRWLSEKYFSFSFSLSLSFFLLAYYIMTPFSGQSAAIQNRKCFTKKRIRRTYFIIFLFCFLQNHLNRFEMMKTFLMIWCRLYSPNNNHLPF